MKSRREQGVSNYSGCIFATLHSLHLEIAKVVKEYVESYLLSDWLRTGEERGQKLLLVK